MMQRFMSYEAMLPLTQNIAKSKVSKYLRFYKGSGRDHAVAAVPGGGQGSIPPTSNGVRRPPFGVRRAPFGPLGTPTEPRKDPQGLPKRPPRDPGHPNGISSGPQGRPRVAPGCPIPQKHNKNKWLFNGFNKSAVHARGPLGLPRGRPRAP